MILMNPTNPLGPALVDTATMTFVSLEPHLTPQYARALPANKSWIGLLF